MKPVGAHRFAPITVIVAVVLSCVIAEIAVRVIFPSNSSETIRKYSLDYDGSTSTRMQFAKMGRLVEVDPDKAWGLKSKDDPRSRTYYINNLGFRGPSF